MPKLYLLLAILLLLGITNAVTAYKFFGFGASSVQTKWDAFELARADAIAEENEKVVTKKAKVKHENQNRNRDALVRHICSRGWVREPDQCKPYR